MDVNAHLADFLTTSVTAVDGATIPALAERARNELARRRGTWPWFKLHSSKDNARSLQLYCNGEPDGFVLLVGSGDLVLVMPFAYPRPYDDYGDADRPYLTGGTLDEVHALLLATPRECHPHCASARREDYIPWAVRQWVKVSVGQTKLTEQRCADVNAHVGDFLATSISAVDGATIPALAARARSEPARRREGWLWFKVYSTKARAKSLQLLCNGEPDGFVLLVEPSDRPVIVMPFAHPRRYDDYGDADRPFSMGGTLDEVHARLLATPHECHPHCASTWRDAYLATGMAL